jgi:2-keto-4-pentenoate hydratase/2-oxohepta-3-ene-1,7-dioic acid hydratase in catechol pathway
MKIASYLSDGAAVYGTVTSSGLVTASSGFRSAYPTLRAVLIGGALPELARDTAGRVSDATTEAVSFLPPIHDAGKIICVGVNYQKRYPLDAPQPTPEQIFLFAKFPGALVAHREALELPRGEAAKSFDYEGEIVVVIGKPGRHIPEEHAMDYVAGFTLMNDGSVRGWQKHSVHAGKNFARSGACGPWMVTANEITETSKIQLTTKLNGEIVQNATLAELIHPLAKVIAYASHIGDLEAGDLIAMGSPEGSGGSRTPPRFLLAGDEVEVSSPEIGVLRNCVGASQHGNRR